MVVGSFQDANGGPPAAARLSGLRGGDVLTAVDGEKTAGQSFDKVMRMFKGKQSVKVEVLRPPPSVLLCGTVVEAIFQSGDTLRVRRAPRRTSGARDFPGDTPWDPSPRTIWEG